MAKTELAAISFSGSEDKSASELGGATPLVVNAIPDATGALRRRPGVVPWPGFDDATGGGSSLGGAIVGMIPFGEFLVFVTESRGMFALRPGVSIGVLSDISTPTSILAGTARPSLLSARTMVLAAGGQQIQKWTGTGLSQRLQNLGDWVDPAPAYPPPDGSFLSAIAQRLVVQVPGASGQIHWSGPLEAYENWDYALGGAGYLQAAAKPDPLVAMFDNTNEVFAFGKDTIQVFAPGALSIDPLDTNNVIDFQPSRTQNIGTISPYSIVAVDDNFALLDSKRRFILTDGRTYQDIGKPVSQILRDLESIEDCWGFRMRFGRFDCVVWFFPTDGFGLTYDMAAQKWSEWRTGGVNEGPLLITSAYDWSEMGLYLVGTSEGVICQLNDGAASDIAFADSIFGVPIKVEVISGFIDHGTMSQKHCRTLLLKFKRTTSKIASITNPVYVGYNSTLDMSGHVRLWMRDDQGPWQHVQDIELSEDPNPCEQIRSLGVYRTRQWRVEYTGADEIQLVGAQEEYEVLGA
jgi:hypothetical protein